MLIYDAFYALDTSVLWCSLHSMEYFALENEVKSAKFLKKIFDFKYPNGILCVPSRKKDFLENAYSVFDFCDMDAPPCPECKDEGCLGSKTSHYVGELSGKGELDSFLLSSEPNYVFVSDAFRKTLERTPFTGNAFIPCDFSYTLFDDPPLVWNLEFNGHFSACDFQNAVQKYNETAFCTQCGWGPRHRPGCGDYVLECPKCGCGEFKSTLPRPDFEQDSFEVTLLDETLTLPKVDARYWEGDDFLQSYRLGTLCVTGLLARWLVENQHGPVILIPLPTDISHCSEEQIKKINQIRFKT